MLSSSESWRPKAREDVEANWTDGELLIFDPSNDLLCCLDPAAAAVWEIADGTRTVSELAAEVASPDEEGEMIVSYALDLFEAKDLLESDGLMSRRQAFSRSALVTAGVAAAAIPTLRAIVMPRTAAAATVHS